MADLSITAANVAKGSTTEVRNGTAGAAITAGQCVYEDSTTSTVKLADADSSAATAQGVGIALHGALTGQPIAYATRGSVTNGATMTAGTFYFVSATAGGICPAADLTTGARPNKLGYASSTTVLVLNPEYTGVLL